MKVVRSRTLSQNHSGVVSENNAESAQQKAIVGICLNVVIFNVQAIIFQQCFHFVYLMSFGFCFAFARGIFAAAARSQMCFNIFIFFFFVNFLQKQKAGSPDGLFCRQ